MKRVFYHFSVVLHFIILSTLYQDISVRRLNIREIVHPNNVYKYIIWNNKEIEIDSKSIFYKDYFKTNIKYTNNLFFDKSKIESFNVLRSEGVTRSNFLAWTGLRQSVPLKLRVNIPNSKVILIWKVLIVMTYVFL